jgi:hypothetical protein
MQADRRRERRQAQGELLLIEERIIVREARPDGEDVHIIETREVFVLQMGGSDEYLERSRWMVFVLLFIVFAVLLLLQIH